MIDFPGGEPVNDAAPLSPSPAANRVVVRSAGSGRSGKTFRLACYGASIAVICLAGVLSSSAGTSFAQRFGDVSTLIAALCAVAACAAAAMRKGTERRGWTWFAVALAVWAVGQSIWTLEGFLADHSYTEGSWADIGFLGYSVPAIVALLSFKRQPAQLISRLRGIVDALVIGASVLFISWALVVAPTAAEISVGWLSWALGQAYPLVDAAVVSLVLFLTMRQPVGARLPWALLTAGLFMLAATDMVFLSLTAQGAPQFFSGPFAIGWVGAMLLMALAALAPAAEPTAQFTAEPTAESTAVAAVGSTQDRHRQLTPVMEIIPYLPVALALVSAVSTNVFTDPFLVIDGAAVLILVGIRQVMIIAEKEALAVDLEERVENRTTELIHAQQDMSLAFDNSPIGMVWSTLDGVIVRTNPVFRQMLQRSEDELVGSSIESITAAADLPATRALFDRAVAEGPQFRITHFEKRYRRKDGGEVWAQVSLFMTNEYPGEPSNLVAQVEDITERRATARELAKQTAFLEAVLEDLDSGVVACDATGKLLLLNKNLRELWGTAKGFSDPANWGTRFDVRGADGQPLTLDQFPLTRALRGERVVNAEMTVDDGQGMARTLIANGQTIHDGEGETLGAVLAIQDVTERRLAEAALTRQTLHDPLTDLANRALLHDRLELTLSRQARTPDPLALLLLDLDGFKLINDSLGHQAGDDVLVILADRLRSCLRADDTIARLGGDEFAVVLENAAAREASAIAEAILVEVRKPILVQGRSITSDASVGIAISLPTDRSTPESILRNADLAMYAAKDSGKGNVQVFTASMHETVLERLTLDAELRRAIGLKQFSLVFQPIISLSTGRLRGFEALARWTHPHRGEISPAIFIPLAEATGLIVPLGQWVLREACKQTARWRKALPGLDQLSVSVNLSVRQLQDATFPEVVAAALRESGLSAPHLQLEITESIFEHRGQHILDMLHSLHAMGVRLVVDDFGTGYSSLSRLHSLPIDKVKIDKSFIDQLAGGIAAPMVAATIAMAHSLGLQAVAEGIETMDQVPFLLLHHCDDAQGYLFGRPQISSEIETALRSGLASRWERIGVIRQGFS